MMFTMMVLVGIHAGGMFDTPQPKGLRRVIIFTTRRDSVHAIASMLAQHAPLITPRIFIGQSGGTAGKK